MLPDGSSVTIPANILTADQTVTLSKLSAPQNPQSGSVVNAGPLLNLSLSVPTPQVRTPLRARNPRNQSSQPDASDIQFNIMIGSNANSTLRGSAPMVDLVTSSGEQNILFPTGTYDQTSQVAHIYLDPTYLSGVEEMNATMANFDSTIPIAPSLSWEVYWDGQSFQQLPLSMPDACPLSASQQATDQNILILVHGMFSSVEGAFSKSAGSIQTNGGYSLLLGLNYDWTQRINASGANLASFIDSVANCPGIQRIDVEAHSEGVAVTLSAGSQLANNQAVALLNSVVALAGPINGTPIADYPAHFAACSAYQQSGLDVIPPSIAVTMAGAVLGLPPFQDLTSTGDPLSSVRQAFVKALPKVQFVAAGGESPNCGSILNGALEQTVFNGHPFDGVIPLDSALGYNSGIPLHPLPPFQDNHSALHDDQDVINDIGRQVTQGVLTPTLTTCDASGITCQGTQGQPFSFLFTESGNSLGLTQLNVYSQDATGTVTQPPNLVLNLTDGGIGWSMTPACSNPPCEFSAFSFDHINELASNSVMQTVQPVSATAAIAFDPTSLNFGSLQTGTSATQSVTLTNTGAATLQITQIDLTNNAGAYSLSNSCPNSLSAGANCTVSVTFSPTQTGTQTATLSVTDNAAGSPQSVPLIGTGTSSVPQLSTFTISPSTITSGQSATLSLGLSGTTNSTATISLISNNPSAFPVPPTVNIQSGQSSTSFSDQAGTVTSTTTVTVTATYNGVSLQAQVVVTPAVQTPVLSTFTISPSTITSGQSATLSLGLSGTTNSTATVSLISNNPSAFPVPPTVNIQSGQSSTSFSDQAGTVTSPTTVTVTATYNGVSLQAQVTVNPVVPTPTLTTFTISPNTISSGQSATLSLGLSGTTSSTATISLSSNNPSAFPVPPTVNIQAGQSSTSFSDQAGTVTSPTTVTVTATYNGVSLQAQVTVNPVVPTIFFISPNPVPIGSAETILISGSGFQTGGTLHFTWTVDGGGSRDRTDYTFVDSGDLLITINTGTVASTGWTVQMTNAGGPPSNVFPFSVQ